MAAISSTTAIPSSTSTPTAAISSRGPFVVPVAPTSLPKIAEFRTAAQAHIAEWEHKSELAREVRDDDRAVERFLIARKFDINAALQMWLDAMKWRDELKLDTVLHNPHPKLLEIRAAMDNHCEHKFDNFGRPIYIEWVGKLDVNKVLPTFTMEHVMEYQFHATEFRRKVLFPRGAALTGKPVDQIVSIVDLKGIEFGKHLTKPVYEFIKKLSACNQAYYPEFLGALYIINAPTIFRIAWVIIRPWLDARTQSKIQILSDDGHAELLKIMSPDSLPSAMKGRCQCRVTPLVRQCAGTSISFKPKKSENKKGTTPAVTAAEAAAAVEFDCANSSIEQQAYFTVALNGLAAYDPSLVPRPVAPTLLVTPTRTPSPSSMSTAEAETSVVSMSDIASPKSTSESSSSLTASMSMSSLPPLSTTPPPQLSAAPSSPSGVPLLPSPAPPVLDEAEYHGYTSSAPSTPTPSSPKHKKQQAATTSSTHTASSTTNGSTSQKSDVHHNKEEEGIPSTTAVSDDSDLETHNGDNDDDNETTHDHTTGTTNDIELKQRSDSAAPAATPSTSRSTLRDRCAVNLNCLQRVRPQAAAPTATSSSATTTTTSVTKK